MRKPSSNPLPWALAFAACTSAAAHKPLQETLWSQKVDDSGIPINAQNYEAIYDAYDSLAADDFIVPAGETWTVKLVEVIGSHYDGAGPLNSMNVVFHRANLEQPAEPGEVVRSLPEQPVEPDGFGTGYYFVPLTQAVKLPAGKYWLSLQGNMDFQEAGQWAWETSHTRRGKPSVWKNPGDAFGTGCTDFRNQLKCIGNIGQGHDFMFALCGKRRGH